MWFLHVIARQKLFLKSRMKLRACINPVNKSFKKKLGWFYFGLCQIVCYFLQFQFPFFQISKAKIEKKRTSLLPMKIFFNQIKVFSQLTNISNKSFRKLTASIIQKIKHVLKWKRKNVDSMLKSPPDWNESLP